jgi:hypothetical protein
MRQKTQENEIEKRKENRKGEEKEQEKKAFLLLGYFCQKAKLKMKKKNSKIDFLGFQLPDVREKKRKTWQTSIFGSHK